MYETILKKIIIKRSEKNISQEYMAEKLNITQSFYSKIENGKRELKLISLLEIAEILELDLYELLAVATPNKNSSNKILKP
jgi:transcriptional regulator with XRE-family HTH domain